MAKPRLATIPGVGPSGPSNTGVGEGAAPLLGPGCWRPPARHPHRARATVRRPALRRGAVRSLRSVARPTHRRVKIACLGHPARFYYSTARFRFQLGFPRTGVNGTREQAGLSARRLSALVPPHAGVSCRAGSPYWSTPLHPRWPWPYGRHPGPAYHAGSAKNLALYRLLSAWHASGRGMWR
jgi:hypothetical protein